MPRKLFLMGYSRMYFSSKNSINECPNTFTPGKRGRKKCGLGVKKGWDVTAFDFIPHAKKKAVRPGQEPTSKNQLRCGKRSGF